MSEGVGSLLVVNAKFASPAGGNPEQIAARRLRRFYLQAVARELLPGARVAECLRRLVPGAGVVNIHYSEKYKRAHYGNLIQCASVWTCPVCASKITERRRVEMSDALIRSPWPAVMVTLTFQHDREDKLIHLRRDLVEARRRLKSGKWWQYRASDFGIVGTITATEVTYGLENGFHIHSHDLYLVESVPDTGELREKISSKFESIMLGLGRYVSPEIGVKVRTTDRGAADYVSKWGAAFEMTKSSAKDGREVKHYTPFELLYLVGTGVKWAGPVFQEFAAAMKGVNQIRWSQGLRSKLGLKQELTDEELVGAMEEDDRILAQLTLKQWHVILKRNKVGELIEVASTGERGLLRAYLLSLGVALADD